MGPLLFLIYINDIEECSEKLKFFLFADDTNILYADKNLRSLELTVNQELSFVIFSPAQRRLTHLPKIKIFDNEQNTNVALECKEFVKYLGILIDNNLSWKNHIDHIVIKISRAIGLSKLRHFVRKHTLINIYRSLIAPYLSYGLIVWGQACKSYLDKLLKLQKRVLRFIYFSDHNQHAIPLFSDAGILPLQFSYYELAANLMFDIIDAEMHLEIFEICLKIFLISILSIITQVIIEILALSLAENGVIFRY